MTKPIGRRQFLAAGASTAMLAAAGVRAAGKAGNGPTRPNIVVIVVDDMRFDEYGAGGHPYLETPHIDASAASGATFRNAYHTTPLGSPNRACILTGQYASRHGIIDNTSRSYASHRLHTFARELQRAGYETAHVGKWHMGPRPGYAGCVRRWKRKHCGRARRWLHSSSVRSVCQSPDRYSSAAQGQQCPACKAGWAHSG